MRFRKLAGVTAGALVAAVVTIPTLATSATAATAISTNMYCYYENYGTKYVAAGSFEVKDGNLEVTFPEIAPFGLPANFTVPKLSAELTVNFRGADKVISGSVVYDTPTPGDQALVLPKLVAPWTGTSLGGLSVKKLDVTLSLVTPFFSADGVMKCEPSQEQDTTFVADCVSGATTFAYNGRVDLIGLTSHTRGLVPTTAALPTEFLNGAKVKKVEWNLDGRIGRRDVSLAGTSSNRSPVAAGATTAVPVLKADASHYGLTYADLNTVKAVFTLEDDSTVAVDCTVTSQDPAPEAEPVAAAGKYLFECNTGTFGWMDYETALPVKAVRSGNDVTLTITPDALPGIVPVALENTPITATVGGTVNGAPFSFSATHDLNIAARAPMPVPALSGVLKDAAENLDVVVTSLKFKAVHPVTTVEIDCATETGSVVLPTVSAPVVKPPVVNPPVENPPTPQPPAVKGASTAKVTKVVYSKKAKKATVRVAVTGKKGTATGKATIVVKRGKTTVQKKVVTLKAGKSTFKTKKLTRKGTYKVTVKYAGNKNYKASKTSKAKTFRIR